MLAKLYRLTKIEVERVYKKGINLRQDFLLVKLAENRTNHCRYAIVIAKKTLPKATARNRVKRVIYDWLSKHKETWQAHHYDMIISVKAAAPEEQINLTLAQIFEKIK